MWSTFYLTHRAADQDETPASQKEHDSPRLKALAAFQLHCLNHARRFLHLQRLHQLHPHRGMTLLPHRGMSKWLPLACSRTQASGWFLCSNRGQSVVLLPSHSVSKPAPPKPSPTASWPCWSDKQHRV